ncbi:TPA: hypothetical protein I8550_004192 [Citrobacter freundii]|nr:hypothetical protein [Citrobacter freundii]HAT3741041.1 hypothetical protein [Citrobacter freundii]
MENKNDDSSKNYSGAMSLVVAVNNFKTKVFLSEEIKLAIIDVVRESVADLVKEELQKQLRPGGTVWRQIKNF